MTMPGLLEVAAHGVTALLATWLGLTVLVRSPRRLSSRVFAFLTLLLVVWSVAIIIERLPHDPDVTRIAHVLEVVPAFLLPAATVHIAVALTVEGRISLAAGRARGPYAVCALAATLGAIDPALEFRVTPPQFSLPGIPGAVFGWAVSRFASSSSRSRSTGWCWRCSPLWTGPVSPAPAAGRGRHGGDRRPGAARRAPRPASRTASADRAASS